MAAKRLRKGQCYRKLERAYTRKSRFRKGNYLKAIPQHKIVKFNMGNSKKEFEYRIDLVSKGALQIRQNALEAARQVANRKLIKTLGPQEFYLMLRIYPHQAQRENKIIAGNKGDRVQAGMGHPFGKIINMAAVVKEGKDLFTAFADERGLIHVKEAFRACVMKLSSKFSVEITKLK